MTPLSFHLALVGRHELLAGLSEDVLQVPRIRLRVTLNYVDCTHMFQVLPHDERNVLVGGQWGGRGCWRSSNAASWARGIRQSSRSRSQRR